MFHVEHGIASFYIIIFFIIANLRKNNLYVVVYAFGKI